MRQRSSQEPSGSILTERLADSDNAPQENQEIMGPTRPTLFRIMSERVVSALHPDYYLPAQKDALVDRLMRVSKIVIGIAGMVGGVQLALALQAGTLTVPAAITGVITALNAIWGALVPIVGALAVIAGLFVIDRAVVPLVSLTLKWIFRGLKAAGQCCGLCLASNDINQNFNFNDPETWRAALDDLPAGNRYYTCSIRSANPPRGEAVSFPSQGKSTASHDGGSKSSQGSSLGG